VSKGAIVISQYAKQSFAVPLILSEISQLFYKEIQTNELVNSPPISSEISQGIHKESEFLNSNEWLSLQDLE
jgi:hypothetical protein